MNLSRIFSIVKKELLQLKRDKTTFAMVVMIPLVQLLLFGFAINTQIRDIPVAVVDQSNSALGRVLIQTVEAGQTVKVVAKYPNVSLAEKAMAQAKVRAVLIIPRDVAERLSRHQALGSATPSSSNYQLVRPIGQWLVDGSDTMITGAIKGLANMPLGELMKQPVNRQVTTFAVTPYYNPAQRSVVNIVPGLVGVILTMTMVMFTSAAIVRERERGNLEMLINTPISSFELMLAKIIPFIFIGALQVTIILSLGYLVFDVKVVGSLLQLGLMTLLFISASLVLGLIISTIAKSQLQAMQLTVFVLLPSILLSGFMFPYEGMPEVAQYIAEGLPATHYIRAMRAIVLRDVEVSEMTYDALWLMGFTLLGLLIASLRFKKQLD
ncbi:Inner membrane transport permease YbhS [Pseudoalteromonas sp. P1-9]|uniref:ABC transporter permease n=1 Tax=Pseudoalteromonas sp. P1-9 TaxID=1710354 RepID=UPI0006D6316C|nr:ABC transporter permease [Pseudoalteromonas sp. P1-9]KPV95087.1 Inner membrane transport permease YbhS [Pseudoalteromonas sp. P1-9]